MDGTPLAFLLQLDLAQLPRIDGLPLPTTGTLLFFYEAEEQAWGFDPQHRGCAQVIYLPDTHPQRESPIRPFPARRLAAFWDYEQLRGSIGGGPVHRIGGYPNELQQTMEMEAHMVTHGIHCGDREGYEEGARRGPHAGAADWRLLLELDSEDALDIMWGDSGRLYFWIHKDGLAARRFDKAWLILQCA